MTMTQQEVEQYAKDNNIDNVAAFIDFLKMWLEAPEDRKQAAEQFIYACNEGLDIDEALNRVTNAEIREEMIQNRQVTA